MVIVLGKRMKLSFDELNEMTMRDLIDIADIYTDQSDGKPQKRKATKADIVNFWGANPNKSKS